MTTPDPAAATLEKARAAREILTAEIGKAIVGQSKVVEELLVALFARGHVLLVGVPGLAKTLMVRTLARILDLSFNRIQFTPDLMPSDITGTDIIEEDDNRRRGFKFLPGPVFANLVLADEINRTPPKTQAALLQAMQEQRVTVNGKTYDLPLPFFVLATQNPIEQEGTYPLPEAQLDRFMFNIRIDYPSAEEECRIVTSTTSRYEPDVRRALSAAEMLEIQDLMRAVPVAPPVVEHAVAIARATRPGQTTLDSVRRHVLWGAGPRASQYLILGAKVRAVLAGRTAASRDDVEAVAPPVLRHRVLTNFQAEADGIDSDAVIASILKSLKG